MLGEIAVKKITLLKMEGCPYCKQAFKVIEQLKAENENFAKIEIIDIKKQAELAKKFDKDYYYVPSIFVENKKLYEAYPGETFEECFENLQRVFQAVV